MTTTHVLALYTCTVRRGKSFLTNGLELPESVGRLSKILYSPPGCAGIYTQPALWENMFLVKLYKTKNRKKKSNIVHIVIVFNVEYSQIRPIVDWPMNILLVIHHCRPGVSAGLTQGPR